MLSLTFTYWIAPLALLVSTSNATRELTSSNAIVISTSNSALTIENPVYVVARTDSRLVATTSFVIPTALRSLVTAFKSLDHDTSVGALLSAAAAAAQMSSQSGTTPTVATLVTFRTTAAPAPTPTKLSAATARPPSVLRSSSTTKSLPVQDFLTLPASLFPEETGLGVRTRQQRGLVVGAAAVGFLWLI